MGFCMQGLAQTVSVQELTEMRFKMFDSKQMTMLARACTSS